MTHRGSELWYGLSLAELSSVLKSTGWKAKLCELTQTQLVTLLTLQQRQVNTESLLSSETQNRILFVFTAVTLFFVKFLPLCAPYYFAQASHKQSPLSWVSSLMALNINGFTPVNSAWSMGGAATASCKSAIEILERRET